MAEVKSTAKSWATMSSRDKTIFILKATIMICSFGFLCSNAFVEGMTYEKLPDPK
ncbi:MAG: hypothetical protein ACO1N5_04570 [Noviherbaspirillum sp.]